MALSALLGSVLGLGLVAVGTANDPGVFFIGGTIVLIGNTVTTIATRPTAQRTIASTLTLDVWGVALGAAVAWIVVTFASQPIITCRPTDQTCLAPGWEYVVEVDCEPGGLCNAKTVKYPKEPPPDIQWLLSK